MSRKQIEGMVIADQLAGTVGVAVKRVFRHPLYKKIIRKTKKYQAANYLGAKKGDRVILEESRPLSKEKHWQVVEVISAVRPAGGAKKNGSVKKSS